MTTDNSINFYQVKMKKVIIISIIVILIAICVYQCFRIKKLNRDYDNLEDDYETFEKEHEQQIRKLSQPTITQQPKETKPKDTKPKEPTSKDETPGIKINQVDLTSLAHGSRSFNNVKHDENEKTTISINEVMGFSDGEFDVNNLKDDVNSSLDEIEKTKVLLAKRPNAKKEFYRKIANNEFGLHRSMVSRLNNNTSDSTNMIISEDMTKSLLDKL